MSSECRLYASGTLKFSAFSWSGTTLIPLFCDIWMTVLRLIQLLELLVTIYLLKPEWDNSVHMWELRKDFIHVQHTLFLLFAWSFLLMRYWLVISLFKINQINSFTNDKFFFSLSDKAKENEGLDVNSVDSDVKPPKDSAVWKTLKKKETKKFLMYIINYFIF